MKNPCGTSAGGPDVELPLNCSCEDQHKRNIDVSSSSSSACFLLATCSAICLKLRSRKDIMVGVLGSTLAIIGLSYFIIVNPSAQTISTAFNAMLPCASFVQLNVSADYDNCSQQQHYSENQMTVMLEKAAMHVNGTKIVIIATMNAAWAHDGSMMDMFLEGFKSGESTRDLLHHLLIGCMDQQAYQRCAAIHPYCLQIKTPGIDFSGEQLYLTHHYILLIWRRILFLQSVLALNYSFIFTDSDILWLRNPLPKLLSDKEADFQIASDWYDGDPKDVHNRPNAGFLYVRPTNATLRFYVFWYEQRRLNSKWADQEVLNAIKLDERFSGFGMKVRFLDTAFFGGFCAITTTDMSKAFTMHANCCKGLRAKLIDLQSILHQWKLYKSTSAMLSTSAVAQPRSPEEAAAARLNASFPPPYACPRSWG